MRMVSKGCRQPKGAVLGRSAEEAGLEVVVKTKVSLFRPIRDPRWEQGQRSMNQNLHLI